MATVKARLERLEQAARPPETFEVWTEDLDDGRYLLNSAGDRVLEADLPEAGPSIRRIVVRYGDWPPGKNTDVIKITWPEDAPGQDGK